jgi:tRNA(fMet)-specific endonuclease VapC
MQVNVRLIDTNVVIKFLNGDEKAYKILNEADEIVISVITVGELYYGIYKSKSNERNIKIISGFLDNQKLLNIDDNISKKYGEIKYELVKKGINIPENHLWIQQLL